LASGGEDRLVRLWELSSGKEVHHLKGHQGSVSSLAFTDDGHFLVSGTRDTTALLWDLRKIPALSKTCP
jgi:WD40 repeat protein